MKHEKTQVETSLGPVAELHGSVWVLDLTGLPIFHGLSVLSRALGDLVLAQARRDGVDINVERAISPRENPELLDSLGVMLVKICAEHGTVAAIRDHAEVFQDHLRALFGTLQRAAYRDSLFGNPSTALVFEFPFPLPGAGHSRFILERVPSAQQRNRCYLRISIENPLGRRLELESFPHLIVRDLHRRNFIAGSTRIAQTWREGLVREAERGRRNFTEVCRDGQHLFRQFAKAGLTGIQSVQIVWSETRHPLLLGGDFADLDAALKRVLLALEDCEVRRLLDSRHTVKIISGGWNVYVDASQLGRMLHLSLGQRRERLDVDVFLERMPATAAVACAGGQPLRGVRIFLIHHLTAEVLGLIAALRRLGCRDLVTLFVTYASESPGHLLGPLLDLPPEEFCCLGLTNVPDEESVEGYYTLAPQYSRLADHAFLAALLAASRRHYFEAMQTVAAVEFLQQLRRAHASGERCLIIEDGGYLAPQLNRACLERRPVRDFLAAAGVESSDERLLPELLARPLIGSVEHTRNGFDRLQQVEREYGALAFPAFSIAISRLKTGMEAEEVSASILNALENILHARGQVLSRRRCIVIGSQGVIGRSLVRMLAQRSDITHLCGVDLKRGPGEIPEARRFRELPDAFRLEADLIVSVTGQGALTGGDVQEWLLQGDSAELTLVSGSSKTVELEGVSQWLDPLLRDPAPCIGGLRVQIAAQDIHDPLTSRFFGRRYRFTFAARERIRDLIVLANMTPVNFLFYGVATEVLDDVLAQLCSAAVGLVRRTAAGAVSSRLFAVDHEITACGEPALEQSAAGTGP